jgi:hypothetical protein
MGEAAFGNDGIDECSSATDHDLHKKTPFYRPRNPSASPFFRIVQQYFGDFERVYPEKYEKKYGFWRKVIHSSIDKFLTANKTGCKPR